MNIEEQTLRNTQDIGTLTGTVSKLATMMGYEVDRAKEDRAGVKEMVTELKGLNEKITGMAGVQKEMAANATAVAEIRTRVDQLKEWKDKYDLSKMDSRIGSLETTKEQEEGAKRVLTTGADWGWRIFGPAVSAVIVAAAAWYFQHSGSPSYESTYTERGAAHGNISGE